MSEALIANLQKQLDEAKEQLKEVRGEAKDRREKAGQLKADLEAAQRSVKELEAARDEWKAKAETSQPELVEQVRSLQGRLRETTHKAAFREVAERHRVNPKALEAAWKLAGYQPTADEVDAAALDALVLKAKADNPFLFLPDEDPADAPPEAPARLTIPSSQAASGRGSDPGANLFRVRNSDLSDASYMDKNGSKIAEARDAGTLVFVNG